MPTSNSTVCLQLNSNPNNQAIEQRDLFDYIAKQTANGVDVVWESDHEYLQRISKIVGVYAEICIHAQQNPFTIEECWTWVVRIINNCTRRIQRSNHFPSEPIPYFIPTVLDIVLRISGAALAGKYGVSSLLNLIRSIKKDIIPTLLRDVKNHKDGKQSSLGRDPKIVTSVIRLNEYVEKALESKGTQLLSIISETDD
jgi:hypothetical protein